FEVIMRIDRLTNQLQTALSDAQSLAIGRDHTQLEPLHVLLAMLVQQGAGTVRLLLNQAGCDVAGLRHALLKTLEQLPRIKNPTVVIHMSQELVRLLNLPDRRAQNAG